MWPEEPPDHIQSVSKAEARTVFDGLKFPATAAVNSSTRAAASAKKDEPSGQRNKTHLLTNHLFINQSTVFQQYHELNSSAQKATELAEFLCTVENLWETHHH